MYAGTDVEHIPNDLLDKNEKLHPYTKNLVEIASNEEKESFSFIEKDIPDPYRSDYAGCPFEPRCKEKENISALNGKHLCKELFPPLVHVESGKIVENERIKEKEHFIRCWLFLKKTSGI